MQVDAEWDGVSKAELFGSTRCESGIADVILAIAKATFQGAMVPYPLKEGVVLSVRKTGAAQDRKMIIRTKSAEKKRMSQLTLLV